MCGFRQDSRSRAASQDQAGSVRVAPGPAPAEPPPPPAPAPGPWPDLGAFPDPGHRPVAIPNVTGPVTIPKA